MSALQLIAPHIVPGFSGIYRKWPTTVSIMKPVFAMSLMGHSYPIPILPNTNQGSRSKLGCRMPYLLHR